MRSFIFDDPSSDRLQQRAAELLAKRLTNRWNEIAEELDRKARQAEDDYYVDSEQSFLEKILDEAEDAEAGQAAVDAYIESKIQRETSLRLEQRTIEGQLAQIGARLMIPYEHYNEEEAYIEYRENTYNFNRY